MDCVHPQSIKNPQTGQWMKVPCGMCIACRIAKTREWKLRILMEKKMWSKSGFLTLTYDDDHLPHTNCGHPTLFPDHLSKFWKRLRKYLSDHCVVSSFRGEVPEGSSPPLLRYFSCGEYGDHTKRPHYHACVFGIDPSDLPVVQKLWPYGVNLELSDLTPERAQYCAGYVQKKIYKDPMKYFKEYGCCVFPFQRISQGIGLGYYERYKSEYWINLRPTVNGVSYSTPRYFTKKDSNLKFAISIISARVQKLNLAAEQEAIESGNDLYASMKQRETNLRAKSRLKKGNL